MLDQIRALPEQLRWAARTGALSLGTHSEVLYVGMGGSGIAGDYGAAVAGPFGTRVTVRKSYGPIPLWAIRQRPLVVAGSFSGNTEETLDFALAAHESGLPVVTLTTGGELAELSRSHSWPMVTVPSGDLQPRAAAGYMLGAFLEVLVAAHAVDDQRLAMVEAADLAERALREGSSEWETARDIAEGLTGRFSIIYGGGPVSGAVAQRWKTQINENAKMPAWYSLLPELDHNEINGWETMTDTTRAHFGLVALTDPADHDRIRTRLAHTIALTEDAVRWVGQVASKGTAVLTRLISLTVVGDLVSWMLAESAGVDPVPVTTIEELKKLLSEDEQ